MTLIAITGWGQPVDRKRALEAGFDEHVTKPFDPDELHAMLTRLSPPAAPADANPEVAQHDGAHRSAALADTGKSSRHS
jgi:DNA-binding response OmpR family regulator